MPRRKTPPPNKPPRLPIPLTKPTAFPTRLHHHSFRQNPQPVTACKGPISHRTQRHQQRTHHFNQQECAAPAVPGTVLSRIKKEGPPRAPSAQRRAVPAAAGDERPDNKPHPRNPNTQRTASASTHKFSRMRPHTPTSRQRVADAAAPQNFRQPPRNFREIPSPPQPQKTLPHHRRERAHDMKLLLFYLPRGGAKQPRIL